MDLELLNRLMKSSGDPVNPIQLPSIKILVSLGIDWGLILASNIMKFWNLMINFYRDSLNDLSKSNETLVISDRFFTIPIF